MAEKCFEELRILYPLKIQLFSGKDRENRLYSNLSDLIPMKN